MIIGSLCSGHFSDWRRARAAKASPTGDVDPEHRLVDQIWGVIICASGVLSFGWFVNYAIHPAAVLAAMFLSELFRIIELVFLRLPSVFTNLLFSWVRNDMGVHRNHSFLD